MQGQTELTVQEPDLEYCWGCDNENCAQGEKSIAAYYFRNGGYIELCKTCAFRLGQEMARRLVQNKKEEQC